MIESNARDITIQGKPGRLSVIRNNGYCWGRIRFAGKDEKQLDVFTKRDHYERTDEEALDSFERAAKRGQVEEAVGWL